MTLQEFNEALNLPYRLDTERVKTVYIEGKSKEKLFFSRENLIIIHLLTQTALAIPKRYENLLIPSNFVVIEFKRPVYAPFFEWYFNEHPSIRRQILKNTQGAVVSTLSIATLRELEIELPAIEKQKVFGQLFQLQQQKNVFVQEKSELETMFIKQTILNQLEELK